MVLEYAEMIINIIGLMVVILGFTVARNSYLSEREKDRVEREYGTFNDLDDKYVDFMYKCTEFPQLDFFSKQVKSNREISEHEILIERAMFSVLISIFERAFLMFEKHENSIIKENQYGGWIECMKMYCNRENFLFEWQTIGIQFDKDFQTLMNKIIKKKTKIKK